MRMSAPRPSPAAAGAMRSGHPQHVAEGAEDDLRPPASWIAESMRATGGTQTGQPGPWIMRTFAGSKSSMP